MFILTLKETLLKDLGGAPKQAVKEWATQPLHFHECRGSGNFPGGINPPVHSAWLSCFTVSWENVMTPSAWAIAHTSAPVDFVRKLSAENTHRCWDGFCQLGAVFQCHSLLVGMWNRCGIVSMFNGTYCALPLSGRISSSGVTVAIKLVAFRSLSGICSEVQGTSSLTLLYQPSKTSRGCVYSQLLYIMPGNGLSMFKRNVTSSCVLCSREGEKVS